MNSPRSLLAYLSLLGLGCSLQGAIPTTYPTGPGPAKVAYGNDGKLVYTYEANGDTIPDYSRAGYQGGGVTIPSVAVFRTLSPIAGTDHGQIQAAVDELAAQPVGADGFRGAILLRAGVYDITEPIFVRANGIVLRGEGDGAGGTILRRTAASTASSGINDAVVFENDGSSAAEVAGTRRNITTAYVPVGASWFALDSTAGYAVGDSIMVVRPSTTGWITTLGQSWPAGGADLKWDRTITEIDGNRIRLDAPVFMALDSQYGTSYVYKYTWPRRLQNVGLENVRADSTYEVDELGNTAGAFVILDNVLNGWVRGCTNEKMRGHTVKIEASKWLTIQDVISNHVPLVGAHSGPSTQINTSGYSNGILWHRLTAISAGFEFSAARQNAGPIVFSESQVPDGFAFSGPHMRWNVGMLFDALQLDHNLAVEKQRTHGWQGGNLLAFNTETRGTFDWERPPTAHQWLHGCLAAKPLPAPNTGGAVAELVSHNTHIEPGSLYRAQLIERVGKDQARAVLAGLDGSNFYWLTPAATSASVPAGNAASFSLQMDVSPGFAGQTVTFTAGGLPAGVTAAFSTLTRSSAGGVTATLATSASTPPGTYNLALRGTGDFPTYFGTTNTLTRTAFVKLTVTAAVPATSVFECENLTVAATSGDTRTINTETGFSGGKGVMFNSNAVGDSLTFLLPNIAPGAYNVKIGVKKMTTRGILQTKVGKADGSTLGNIGTTKDLYGTSAYVELDIGTWTIGVLGDKHVQFVVTGKNASSTGYTLCFDYIKLTKQ